MSLALSENTFREPDELSLSHSFSSLIPPMLTTFALGILVVASYLLAFNGDLSALICVDQQLVGQPPFEQVTTSFPNNGYDGQFYYSIAQNPWTKQPSRLDSTGARHLRILYPTLAWLVTGGDTYRLFLALPLINLFVLAGLTWLGARFALSCGRSAWWGVLLPVVTAMPMAMLRNLTDPLALFCVLGLLYVWIQRRPSWQVGLWGLAAMLSREQNIAIIGILFLLSLGSSRREYFIPLSLALLAQAAWILSLRWVYGSWPFLPSQGNLGLPLSGMLIHAQKLLTYSGSRMIWLMHVFGLLLIILQMGIAIVLLIRSRDRGVMTFVMLSLLLTLCAGANVYESPWSFVRALSWLPLGIWLMTIQSERRWPILLLALNVVWPMAIVAQAHLSH